ncbi:hypothetical protein TNCV_657561 [Trichonephila clavipes]|nr:hypothetical protein TNCV_657561 [Trichonephila clavipes]
MPGSSFTPTPLGHEDNLKDNVERQGWNERRMSTDDDKRRNWRNSEVLHRTSNNRNNYRGNYETARQGNQWVEI